MVRRKHSQPGASGPLGSNVHGILRQKGPGLSVMRRLEDFPPGIKRDRPSRAVDEGGSRRVAGLKRADCDSEVERKGSS